MITKHSVHSRTKRIKRLKQDKSEKKEKIFFIHLNQKYFSLQSYFCLDCWSLPMVRENCYNYESNVTYNQRWKEVYKWLRFPSMHAALKIKNFFLCLHYENWKTFSFTLSQQRRRRLISFFFWFFWNVLKD